MGFLFETLGARIATFLSDVADTIVEEFRKTPLGELVSLIEGLLKLLPAFAAELTKAIRMPGPPEPPDDGKSLRDTLRGTKAGLVLKTPDALADVIDRATELPLPDLPKFSLPPLPKVPKLPDKPALEAKIGRAGPVDLAAEAKRLLKEARASGIVVQPEEILKRPASIFGPEMRALEAQGKPTVTAEDTRLRNALYLAVGRVLPGDLRVYAPKLKSFFDEIDKQLYGAKPAEAPELPQQDLDHGGRLQPKVDKLRIRARNALAPDIRAFRDQVVDRMKRQDYFAPAAAGADG
jgi:hypothetical protein